MTDYLLVLAGLGALMLGAEFLVRGGSAMATRFGVSPLLVGITVVSIGTSLPELAIGVDAALNDAGPLAVGNIAGTNIVNILLILGLSAAIAPLALQPQTIRLDLPVIVASALLLWVLAANGMLTRLDGILLLLLAVAYTFTVVRHDLTHDEPVLTEEAATVAPAGPWWRDLLMLGAGVAVVIAGADWLVSGAVRIAGDLGVSEAVIGLTVAAIGTSAPELVTTVMSTLRGQRDLAIGNLIGSSVYNVTFILGTTALIRPIEVTSELIRIDIPLMAAVALLCIPVFISGRRITRIEGMAFIAGYLVYLTTLIVLRT